MKTYTLFLPGITEADCPADESEFEIFTRGFDNEYDLDFFSQKQSDGDQVSDTEYSSDEYTFTSEYVDAIVDDIEDVFSDDLRSESFTIPEASDSIGDLKTYDDIFAPSYGMYALEDAAVGQYDEIPDYYADKKSWIKSTNLLCISCSNKIQGMPMFIPLSWHRRVVTKTIDRYDDAEEYAAEELSELNSIGKSGKGSRTIEERVMKVYRLTCNERCAKYYINNVRDANITNPRESLQMLKMLVQEIRGVTVTDIKEGLNKSIMMQYKGPSGVDVARFREMNSVDGHYT